MHDPAQRIFQALDSTSGLPANPSAGPARLLSGRACLLFAPHVRHTSALGTRG